MAERWHISHQHFFKKKLKENMWVNLRETLSRRAEEEVAPGCALLVNYGMPRKSAVVSLATFGLRCLFCTADIHREVGEFAIDMYPFSVSGKFIFCVQFWGNRIFLGLR
jgi:hypothetical protein